MGIVSVITLLTQDGPKDDTGPGSEEDELLSSSKWPQATQE